MTWEEKEGRGGKWEIWGGVIKRRHERRGLQRRRGNKRWICWRERRRKRLQCREGGERGQKWGIRSEVDEGWSKNAQEVCETEGGQRQMKGWERSFTCCWCIVMLARITLDTQRFNLPSNKHTYTHNISLSIHSPASLPGAGLKYLNPEQSTCHVRLVCWCVHTHTNTHTTDSRWKQSRSLQWNHNST